MFRRLKIAVFVLALSSTASAQEAPSKSPSWGWLVVAGSLVAGAVVTTYGLTIDCSEDDTDCHRRAALPIWGGVGMASAGSLVGLCIVQSDAGPSGTAMTVSLNFD